MAKQRIFGAVLLIWIVPVTMLIVGMLLLLDSISEQTTYNLQTRLDTAALLAEQRLRVVADDSRKLSYDRMLEEQLDRLERKIIDETGFYQEVDAYLRLRYGISRQYLLSLVFLEESPDFLYFSDLDGRWIRAYRENTHQGIREFAAGLGTHIGFYIENNQIFAVRNLYAVDGFRKLGTMVLQIDPAYLYLDDCPNGELSDKLSVSITPGVGTYTLDKSSRPTAMLLETERKSDDFTLHYSETVSRADAFEDITNAVALLLLMLLLLVSMLAPAMVYIKRGHQRDLELAQKDALILALQSQINPHFLNNTLEMINWQARLEGAVEVPKMIEALSRILDASMSREQRAIIPLSEELLAVDAYLYILSMRLGKRLTVEKHIDRTLLGVRVPALLMQPLVENAVKHGIDKAHKGIIVLDVYADEKTLTISVTNDGAPLSEMAQEEITAALSGGVTEPNTTRHLGIRNINARVKLIYGDVYGLTITRGEEGRTVAKITLPKDP